MLRPTPFTKPRKSWALGSSGHKKKGAREKEPRARPFSLSPTTSKRLLRRLRKSPNSYHWTKQALLQESLLLPFSQRPTIIQVFLPSRILLMVDVLPLKNFPRKQTLIGNGGNSGGGGGRYKKREEQITFHHNFKYGKTKRRQLAFSFNNNRRHLYQGLYL